MFKFLCIILCFTSLLFSSVRLKSPSSFYENEAFLFSFEMSANEIKIPKINKIDDYEVFPAGNSSSYSSINGKIQRTIKRTYAIYPKKDFIIPSFTFILNGKEIKSLSKKISKIKIKKTKSQNFDLSIISNKKDLYVGEDTLLTIVFKYKKDLQLVDLSLDNPVFNNFWFMALDDNKQYEENGYIVQKLFFLIFPQKEGLLNIPSIKVNLKVLDAYSNSFSFFTNESKSLKIYSNDLFFNVKSLPENISLFGDFKISTKVNASIIKEGEAISYKINIEGFGNIDDLEDIKLSIDNTSIYENKAKIEKSIKNSLYYASYNKSFSIIANKDFTIPSYTLSYLDKKTKTIKTIKSKEYKISVVKNKIDEKIILEKNSIKKINDDIVYKNDYKNNIFFFILGSIFTLVIFFIYKFIKIKPFKENRDLSLIIKVKSCKNKNDLLKLLSKYLLKNKELDEKIYILEESKISDYSLHKKEIINLIKNLIKKGQI